MNIKYSIIIPVYNCENTIYRCLKSILNQTYTFFEVLIVNNNSTDSSVEIINNICKEDNRLKLLNEHIPGPSNARNTGINASCGDYIIFIDGDDTIDSNYLQLINNRILCSKPDVCFVGYKMFDANGTPLLKSCLNNNELLSKDIFGYTWCKIVSSPFLKLNNFYFDPSYSLHEDLLFTINLLMKKPSILLTDICGYNYYKYNNSLCSIFRNDIIENMDFVNERFIYYFSNFNDGVFESEILKRLVFSFFLILKNYKSIKLTKDLKNEIFKSYTFIEMAKRRKMMRHNIKGKKKFLVYLLCKYKSRILLHMIFWFYKVLQKE